jgi:serine kinase of HPr protein (carbohydrate metabolism regulator)
MTIISSETLHASCVAIGDRAVLIEGLSGSGKSDLALRLIDRGALLVSDDYTVVRRAEGHAVASSAPNIDGLLEVRGVGLVRFPTMQNAAVALVASLNADVERLPEGLLMRTIAGVQVPVLPVAAFEASAPIKIELTLKALMLT